MKNGDPDADAPEAIGTYSQAVRAGDTRLSLRPDRPRPGDHADGRGHRGPDAPRVPQPRGGGRRRRARPRPRVRMTVYLTDLAHFARVNEIMAQYVQRALSRARRRRRRRPAARRAGRDRRHPARGVKSARELEKLGLRSRLRLRPAPAAALRGRNRAHRAAMRRRRAGRCASRRSVLSAPQVVFRPQAAAHRACRRPGAALLQFLREPAEAVPARRGARPAACAPTARCARGLFGAEMAHPRYRFVQPGEPLPETLTPVYPTTAGRRRRRSCARRVLRGARRRAARGHAAAATCERATRWRLSTSVRAAAPAAARHRRRARSRSARTRPGGA